MRRVVIVGSPGAGKSTVARRLATAAGLRHVELDALWHRPGWTTPPVSEFRLTVAEQLSGDGWVVDGNYRQVQDLTHGAADTIVWLDLPRRLVVLRVIRRTVWRIVTRARLWGDNRETLRTLVSRDPEESMIVWTWTQFPRYRALYSTLAHDGSWDHAAVWHLRTRADVGHFLSSAGRRRHR